MNRYRSSLGLLLVSGLFYACSAPGPDVAEEDGLPASKERDVQTATPDTAALRLRHDADGSVFALARTDRAPLFRFDPRGEPAAALLAFAAEHAAALGFDEVRASDRLTTLQLERVIELSDTMRVHRYHQLYRGHRIAGAGEKISVTSLADGSVVAVHGALVDERRVFAGLSSSISRQSARDAVVAAVGGGDAPELELVAVPRHGVMAWSADAGWPARERVIVSASDGAVLSRVALSAHDAFDHAPLLAVRASTMTNNPAATTTTGFPGAGSIWDGSFNPTYGHLVRMGDDRAVVYDMNRDNDGTPGTYLSMQRQPGPPGQPGPLLSVFTATPTTGDGDQFRTQNLYQKMRAALVHLDARQSTLGWDHAPGTPFGLFTPAPLTLLTNVDSSPEVGETALCGAGALGTYNDCTIGGAAIQAPYPGETVSCVYMCGSAVGTLLHELGHHVDNHADYGIMGSSGGYDSCIQGTTDESIPLRETIGDMTALYLARKMYGSLSYSFSTASSPCTFGSVGQGTFAVHDPSCLGAGDSIGDFADDRPAHDANDPCNYASGYRMESVNQAVWAWLNRKSCSVTAPFSCVTFLGGNVDNFMAAMVYALAVSNAQSYQTFFENIELYYEFMVSSTEADNFRFVMSKYGILD